MTERDDTRESETDNESDGKLNTGDILATSEYTTVLQEAQVLFTEILSEELIEFFPYCQVRLYIFISEYFVVFPFSVIKLLCLDPYESLA